MTCCTWLASVIIVCGSSRLDLIIFGPKTMARLEMSILLSALWHCTSSRKRHKYLIIKNIGQTWKSCVRWRNIHKVSMVAWKGQTVVMTKISTFGTSFANRLSSKWLKNQKREWIFGPVPSPRGALVGLASPNKTPSPPNRNMKHCKSVEFVSDLECQAPPHKRKAPLFGRWYYLLRLTSPTDLLFVIQIHQI